ncbi:hypothetical protein Tco_1226955 [Tanacetum coccineum]
MIKKCSNPTSAIFDETIANPNAQIVGDDMVRVQGLESKEVSPLGEELSLFDRPNEVERGRILEAHRLESILQQQISQRMAPSHHDGINLWNQVIFDEKKLGSSQEVSLDNS